MDPLRAAALRATLEWGDESDSAAATATLSRADAEELHADRTVLRNPLEEEVPPRLLSAGLDILSGDAEEDMPCWSEVRALCASLYPNVTYVMQKRIGGENKEEGFFTGLDSTLEKLVRFEFQHFFFPFLFFFF